MNCGSRADCPAHLFSKREGPRSRDQVFELGRAASSNAFGPFILEGSRFVGRSARVRILPTDSFTDFINLGTVEEEFKYRYFPQFEEMCYEGLQYTYKELKIRSSVYF